MKNLDNAEIESKIFTVMTEIKKAREDLIQIPNSSSSVDGPIDAAELSLDDALDALHTAYEAAKRSNR